MTFVGFTFPSEVPLGRLARFYGLSIPEGHHETPLADFVRAGLPDGPSLGDRISLGSVDLVIGGMNGERITKIGLDLQSAGAARPPAGRPQRPIMSRFTFGIPHTQNSWCEAYGSSWATMRGRSR